MEINVLARLRYKHLVTLRGACAEQKNRIAVFDFMPGGSLRDNLDRRRQSISCWHSPPQNLLWPARIEVALGAAKGLRFLHEVSIKSSIETQGLSRALLQRRVQLSECKSISVV